MMAVVETGYLEKTKLFLHVSFLRTITQRIGEMSENVKCNQKIVLKTYSRGHLPFLDADHGGSALIAKCAKIRTSFSTVNEFAGGAIILVVAIICPK